MISQFILYVKCTMIISCFIFKCIVFALYAFVLVYRIAVHSEPLAGWLWPESKSELKTSKKISYP